jgi:ribonuclease BN (tRNA processing enzyme)
LPATIDFHEVNVYDTFPLAANVRIKTARLNHPYRAVGYRIESNNGCLAYITDTAPFDQILFGDEQVSWSRENRKLDAQSQRTLARMRQGVLDLCADADWVIYDTQFKPEEYAKRPHWGHSTPEHAIELAVEAAAQHLVLFHHDPHRTDDEVDEIESIFRARAVVHGLHLTAAREGLVLTSDT